MRLDGFVSIHAPMKSGEVITRPITFSGSKLTTNFATSAAGSMRVEIQDNDGKPCPGYSLDECPAIFGDTVDRVVRWNVGGDVSRLAGQPVRLRFELRDADLFSFRFVT